MEKLKIKIKDLVEMTQDKSMKEVAKDFPVGEQTLRKVLKQTGCKPPEGVGAKGWRYDEGNQEVERELSEFVRASKPRKTKSKNNNMNASIYNNTDSNNDNNTSNENNIENNVIESKNIVNDDSNNETKEGDNMVMEIKDLIKGKGKDDNARVYKGIYFDKDVANFLDNVQHGNKSEIVNKILRQYLTDNELM